MNKRKALEALGVLRGMVDDRTVHGQIDIIAKFINDEEPITTIAASPPKAVKDYYDAGGVSVIDVIKSKLTPEQFEGFCLGNAIKYALRANHKGAYHSDIKKLADYSIWLNDSANP